jgi:Zn2+/Cd2+-exporting ATPase
MASQAPASHSDSDHDHGHDHSNWQPYVPIFISSALLLSGLVLEFVLSAGFFSGSFKIIWYAISFLPVGWPVVKSALLLAGKGQIFTEFFLMSIATLGAFAIGEYQEAVAVMLFYAIGEWFQYAAVTRAKGNIQKLLDIRSTEANVWRANNYITTKASSVQVGENILVRVGEKIPLDGKLLSEKASLNTAALTGESTPRLSLRGELILAGSINMAGPVEVEVKKLYNDSSIARILDLVQHATAKKSETELLIRRLAKIYTPLVVYLAIAIVLLPWFFLEDYHFQNWLYRALIFLVISCPCALVISIPLGYFGGLGAASQQGILFKGATYLDLITKVNTLVMDKTGTVTKGVFKIKNIFVAAPFTEKELMPMVMALEKKSTHPIGKAILAYPHNDVLPEATEAEEFAGKGLKGLVSGKVLLVGNQKLMEQFSILVPPECETVVETIVLVSVDGAFAGYIVIGDELKADAIESIRVLRKAGIQQIHMLSGDKQSITQKVAESLGLDSATGNLLPEAKLHAFEALKAQKNNNTIAFVGDGINDAPVLAASDLGIAMGGIGTDLAIETADIIIQTDQPSKIATAIQIGKATRSIIFQNIALAFGVKFFVLLLGALGMATMWAAVFADVGVALLAILNAVRLQKMFR